MVATVWNTRASGSAPSASSLGVPDFVDEWVSAPYPDQVKDRPIILDGKDQPLAHAFGAHHDPRMGPLAGIIHQIARHLVKILRLAGDRDIVRDLYRQPDRAFGMNLGEDIAEVANARGNRR